MLISVAGEGGGGGGGWGYILVFILILCKVASFCLRSMFCLFGFNSVFLVS